MAHIFISYAREDETRIRSLVHAFENQGWSVFWDRRIPAGQTWRSHIDNALTDANCVIAAWSHYSINSNWVIEEADEGKKRGILVPVLLDAVEPPIGFRSIQTADLTDWRLEHPTLHFEQLLQDIAKVLNVIAPPITGLTEPENIPGQTRELESANFTRIQFGGKLIKQRFFDLQRLTIPWWGAPLFGTVSTLPFIIFWVHFFYGWEKFLANLEFFALAFFLYDLLILLSKNPVQRLRFARLWIKTPGLADAVYGTIDVEGIEWNSMTGKVRYPWSKLIKHKESKDMLLVYASPNSAFYFPREFFASEADWESFRKIVRANFKKKRRNLFLAVRRSGHA